MTRFMTITTVDLPKNWLIVVCRNESRSSNPQTAAPIGGKVMKHWHVPSDIGRLVCPE